jgi:hypothetical protein
VDGVCGIAPSRLSLSSSFICHEIVGSFLIIFMPLALEVEEDGKLPVLKCVEIRRPRVFASIGPSPRETSQPGGATAAGSQPLLMRMMPRTAQAALPRASN